MKAKEMPERIYIFDYNDAMVTPLEGDTVYVRKDAFIEKAVEWLENLFAPDGSIVPENIRLFEDFRKYMGE